MLDEAQSQRFRNKLCADPDACRTACDEGAAERCRDWGVVLALGDRVPRDLRLSSRAFRRACELGDMPACTMIGITLLTRGPRADADRGRGYLERPCERGVAAACSALAISHDNAGEVEQARSFRKCACDLGDTSACSQ